MARLGRFGCSFTYRFRGCRCWAGQCGCLVASLCFCRVDLFCFVAREVALGSQLTYSASIEVVCVLTSASFKAWICTREIDTFVLEYQPSDSRWRTFGPSQRKEIHRLKMNDDLDRAVLSSQRNSTPSIRRYFQGPATPSALSHERYGEPIGSWRTPSIYTAKPTASRRSRSSLAR